MSKPTIDDMAYAIYVISMNLNGQCPYCQENMSGMPPKYKVFHHKKEHKK